MQTLRGRTCVFAGATGTLGKGAVKELAEGGMNVVMVTHEPASAKEIVEEFAGKPGVVTAVSNTIPEAEMFRQIRERFGSVDVVINSTGGMNAPCEVEDVDTQELVGKLEHQVAAPFHMVQAALPFLKESRCGRVILTTTAGAINGFEEENIVDSISRGSVVTMTRALARVLAKAQITVNCVARSGMVNDHEPASAKEYDSRTIEDKVPLGHLGTPEEYGALIAYIASEEASFTTGQVFDLSGGLRIG